MTTDFEAQTAPLRRELLAHCYRMMGSVTDAEDQVQETYLRAWRAFHDFDRRSSVRTWMHRIATNSCLNALSSASTRVLPSGLGAPPGDPTAPITPRSDVSWIEPLPDAVLWQHGIPTPEEKAVARERLSLAWLAALQGLPPTQRAVLLLREVLGLPTAEIAELLETSTASVNSALQRGRARIGEGLPEPEPGRDERTEAASVEAFVSAFERHDFDAVVASLAEDVTWQMPPFDQWYLGARAAADLSWTHCPAAAPGDLRFLTTRLNGSPAVGMYLRRGARWEAFQLQALNIDNSGHIDQVIGWFEPHLFLLAGLPMTLDSAGVGHQPGLTSPTTNR